VDPNPGGHALYLSEGLRTVIRNNLIHDNGARGVQLRNQILKPLVEGNVIHDNGWGVALDNDVTKAVVRGNVITDNPKASVATAPMYSGSNNRVVGNCVWQADGDGGLGHIDSRVAVSGNVTADPRYEPFPTVTNPDYLDKYAGTLER
jgi:Right handed beta helix region